MKWSVALRGSPQDLRALVTRFPAGRVRVFADDEETWVSGVGIEKAQDPSEAYREASHWLQLINGTATALEGQAFGHVELSGRVRDDDDPESAFHVVGAGVATAVAVAYGVAAVFDADGSEQETEPNRGPLLVTRALEDPALRAALRWMSEPEYPDWDLMWKAFESLAQAAQIDRRVSPYKQLSDRTGVSADEIEAFKASANDPTVSGDAARHSVQTQPLTAKSTMNPEQGREFISRLVLGWLEHRPGN